jgi:Zn-dependent protease
LPPQIASSLINLIVLVLSLTVHEFSHAWVAWRLGDDTAARMGRLTLNPIPHLDLIGTIVLPLMGAPIGWAKPVPVNPANFRRNVRMSTGDILVSVAGPLSNLAFAFVAAVLLGTLARISPSLVVEGAPARLLLGMLMATNIGLAMFNLLPIPPLDGSHVLGSLLPYRFRDAWDRFAQLGPFLLLAMVLLGRGLLWRVLGPPVELLRDQAFALANLIAS